MMKDGADLLRVWIIRQGFSQQDAAEFFGWHESMMSKLLKRARRPGLVNALKIKRLTGIPIEAWEDRRVDESSVTVSAHGRKRK